VKTTCDACLTIQDGLTVDRADTYNYAVIAWKWAKQANC
jgi:hypothetical protein